MLVEEALEAVTVSIAAHQTHAFVCVAWDPYGR